MERALARAVALGPLAVVPEALRALLPSWVWALRQWTGAVPRELWLWWKWLPHQFSRPLPVRVPEQGKQAVRAPAEEAGPAERIRILSRWTQP